ncbi:Protein of unknown function [Bacillus toyonensis]|nr:Protein of unknown function [Bacillus toyonensis]
MLKKELKYHRLLILLNGL